LNGVMCNRVRDASSVVVPIETCAGHWVCDIKLACKQLKLRE
jgi:hypothetical protein